MRDVGDRRAPETIGRWVLDVRMSQTAVPFRDKSTSHKNISRSLETLDRKRVPLKAINRRKSCANRYSYSLQQLLWVPLQCPRPPQPQISSIACRATTPGTRATVNIGTMQSARQAHPAGTLRVASIRATLLRNSAAATADKCHLLRHRLKSLRGSSSKHFLGIDLPRPRVCAHAL
jgi:hypothetical protein